MASNPRASTNYRDTYFEFPTLTPIRGEPSADNILLLKNELKNELKANAKSVPSNLGSGAFGHLGLILTPAKYTLLSDIPFERPSHPGPRIISPETTQHAAITMRDLHQESLRVFTQVHAVEQHS